MSRGQFSYVGLIVAAAIALAGCGSSSSSSTTSTSEPKSEAETLAQIQKGEPVNADDPLVARFNRLLAELRQGCRHSGDATLADNVVNTRELLKEHGIEESVQDILENVTGSIRRKFGLSCVEAFAAYGTLREKAE